MTFRNRVILIPVLILFAHVLKAQGDDFNFITFSNRDGLSANTANVILKDKYGYMWFGTDDGLNKFDGETFTVYRHHPGDTTSLRSNRINAICQDSLGNLWVGTGASLSFYDRKKDSFINYDFPENAVIRTLCLDHLGNLWVGSYLGLFMMDLHSGKITRYEANPTKNDQLLSNTIVSLFEDSRKRLWVGTNKGLLLFNKPKNNFIRYQHSASDSLSIPDNTIRAIAEDLNGNLWFGTDAGGLCVMLLEGKFRTLVHDPNDTRTLSSNRVWAIVRDYDGKLWLGTNDGINILDTRSNQVLRVKSDPRNKYSLGNKFVRSIYIDKSGVYWIGTFQGGISKYDKNLVFFNLRQSNPFDHYGLSSGKVTSFLEDSQGDIYVGTDGGGVNHYHRKTGLFCHPELTRDRNNQSLAVRAMEHVGSELWVGTYERGLYLLNMKTNAVTHYGAGVGSFKLSSDEIFCLKKDRKGNVWVGTNGNGVDVINPAAGILHHFDKTANDIHACLPLNGYIRTIEEDALGNIWMGSDGTGVAIYTPSTKSFKLLNRVNSNLPSNNVFDIYKDQKGNIWIGTDGGGLSRWDGGNKFTSYSEADGLANASIHKILESETGKLWVSTNNGVSSFDEKTKRFKNYSYQNGLQKNTFISGAGLKTSSGELFFGGLDGFNFITPPHVLPNRTAPSLVFTDLKISNRSIIPGPKEAIKENISVAQKITLSHKENFSLEFVSLNYTDPHETRYSYKLDGFDKDWNNVGSSQKAVYTNLDPGHYTFRLKAASDDGLWQSPETFMRIYVKPPFWRTIYAYIIYVLLLGGFLIAWRYWGIRRLKNKFALVQERLRFGQMLEQERKDAEQKHELDQAKIKFLTNLSHEFRTPISLIAGPAEQLLETELNEVRKEQLGLIRRNAKRLLNLVNQLLDFRKLEQNELTLITSEGDLVSFVQDIGDSFKDASERKHINFIFASTISHFYTSFDKDKLERILFNLLSNAFKFTKTDGRITLKIERHLSSDIKIIITDTGIGMTPDVQRKIFDRFFQGGGNPAIMNQGNGIGLSITKEFVKLHGGSIKVESEEGKGSTFTVCFPFKPVDMPVTEPLLTPAIIKSIAGITSIEENEARSSEKPLVLIIEDHDDFRKYLNQNLGGYYRIIEAVDGKQGWEKILASHPQVIVSDINMPEMDGVLLCRKIKSDKRTSHIPVILLTALTGDANQLIGLNTGANDYLTKPFNFEILNIKIRNLLKLNQNLKTIYSKQVKVITQSIEMPSEDEKLLINIIQYIESNIDNPDISVDGLRKHFHLTRGTFYNKIVSLTGASPVEFIRSFKLDKAAGLLENSDLKVTEIGYAVGFPTPNYFTRAFKVRFNMSPSEYMKLKRTARKSAN